MVFLGFFYFLRFWFLTFLLFFFHDLLFLLNFSSMLLIFLSRSWIVFANFIYLLIWILFESSSRLLNSLSAISLSVDSVFVLLQGIGRETLPWFFKFIFLHCDWHYWAKFLFYFLKYVENLLSNQVNNSAKNKIFEWVRNNWNCLPTKLWFLVGDLFLSI